mgnify:CR=1 FL=1
MATYTPKTIEEAQQIYYQALADANSGLRLDTTQGSVVYTLGRGSAAIAVQQDTDLKDLADSINLSTATGNDLDIYSTFGLTRGAANKASGTVLCLSNDSVTTLAPNTILINPQSNRQYVTQNAVALTVSYVEVPVKVEALLAGYLGNLGAGTRLYSTQYPGVSFVVGNSRSDLNTYTGDITGGTDVEDDDRFRTRIASWMLSHSTCAKAMVLNRLLTFPGVAKAFTVTRAGGVLELWVDSPSTFNAAQKLELTNYVLPYIAAGIVPAVSQITRKAVDISLSVVPYVGTDLDVLSSRFRQIILSFINKLELGQDLSIDSLSKVLSPLASKVSISPTKDVVASVGEMIVLGNLDITYPV